jgi:hypothetical protein
MTAFMLGGVKKIILFPSSLADLIGIFFDQDIALAVEIPILRPV